MKSHEALIRLKTFQVEDKRRKVVQIETMIAEFDRMANDLDREIRIEQDRSGIHDPSHYAYPTYAKAALARRENLRHSADELRTQLADAKIALQEACEERRKISASCGSRPCARTPRRGRRGPRGRSPRRW